jgi:dipeptidyl aminopeptidase/acylaminoacyl peptidase
VPTFPSAFRAALWCALLLCGETARADSAASGLRAHVAANRKLSPAPLLAREAFLARRPLRGLTLSPDGQWLAYVRMEGLEGSLWTLHTGSLERRQRLHTLKARQVYWSTDSQWLFLETAHNVAGVPVDGGGSVLIASLEERRRQVFAGVDPVLPRHFLLTEKEPEQERYRLLRVDVQGKRELLYEGTRPLSDFVIDPKGGLAFIKLPGDGHQQVIYRASDGGWREVLRCEVLVSCELLGTSADHRTLLMRSDREGNLQRVVELDTATGVMRTVHADPEKVADLDEVVLDPTTAAPLLARYHTDRQRTYGLKEPMTRHVAAIERRFPGRAVRIALGSKSRLWLLTERAAQLQWERYYLYDSETQGVREILDDERARSTSLPEAVLGRTVPVRYRASDGMWLHGFLVLPPGSDAARVPLVVRVHGGPWSQVRNDFDALTQFLVNRGYAVFEPNFRGSTGYGREYVLAARGDFGNGRVQQDILEGVRYVLAQGVGDRERVALMGHSFGGYSTLLGLTFTPDLFRVGIATAAPSDLSWALRWMGEAEQREGEGTLRARLRALSLDLEDAAVMARLREQSPERNAAKLGRPLLLLAGAKDERVAVKSVTHYAARLKALGKDVSLLIDPDSGHGLDEPLASKAQLYLLERMLHRHLGGRTSEGADPELGRYLERNLRVTGEGLKPAG